MRDWIDTMRWRTVIIAGFLLGAVLVLSFWVAMDRIIAPLWVEQGTADKSGQLDNTYCYVAPHGECGTVERMNEETGEVTPVTEIKFDNTTGESEVSNVSEATVEAESAPTEEPKEETPATVPTRQRFQTHQDSQN